MDNNLVVRVLENARKYKDSSIDYDPLIRAGYTDQQIGNAIEYKATCCQYDMSARTTGVCHRKMTAGGYGAYLRRVEAFWMRNLST